MAINNVLLFSSPEEQIELLLSMNEDVWKDASVTRDAIRSLGEPPTCPPPRENVLYCVFLNRETGDPIRTFDENHRACDRLHRSPDDLPEWTVKGHYKTRRERQLPTGLSWVIAELGREFRATEPFFPGSTVFRGKPPKDIVEASSARGVRFIGQELWLIVALHVKWAKYASHDTNVPVLYAPDIVVMDDADLVLACPCFKNSDMTGSLTRSTTKWDIAPQHLMSTGRLFTVEEFSIHGGEPRCV